MFEINSCVKIGNRAVFLSADVGDRLTAKRNFLTTARVSDATLFSSDAILSFIVKGKPHSACRLLGLFPAVATASLSHVSLHFFLL